METNGVRTNGGKRLVRVNERRAIIRQQEKDASRKIDNNTLMVNLCRKLLCIDGETLASTANNYSNHIDLMGWFAVGMDEGVLFVASEKDALFSDVEYSYVDAPILERHGKKDFYTYRTNARTHVGRTMHCYMGTWEGLTREGFGHHLETWLKEQWLDA